MKYLLIATVVMSGCVLLLGPLSESLTLPPGVEGIMEDLGRIF